ncbi:MAG: rhodanese-like domain-containing protein [Actinomycetota bacterium]
MQPTIIPLETSTLGDRSYLAHDGRVALVVDPQRDIDRVLDLAAREGVRITDVFETHLHNDYVSGGLALARQAGATYHVSGQDTVTFDRHPLADGDVVPVGEALRVRVRATPGHTFNHLSYVLESAGEPVAVFTGGSLLYGSTGRPDLLGPEHTPTLARLQHASARRLADELPDQTTVLPTHGFGSFCSSSQSQAESSSIGQEKRANPVLTQDEQAYVDQLLAGLDAWPAYYVHMAPLNQAGAFPPDLSPPHRADPAEVRRRIQAGEWVVDLRSRTAFAAGFLPGTLNFGLDGSFATYLGWTIPWGMPLTLLAETPEQVAEAQRELVRIGIDRPVAAATGAPQAWADGVGLATYRRATFADLARERGQRDLRVLDVRRNLEWANGHVEGAVHIPLHDLPRRLGQVPDGEVWVYCGSGYRASIAASLVATRGRRVVVVDDDVDRAGPAGLPVVREGGEDR